MAKNYYITLGISPNASQNEIKRAYRDKVKHLHPDHYGANREPFLDVQEAYAVLNDPMRRKKYDESTRLTRKVTPSGRSRVSPDFSEAEPLIPRDLDLEKSFYTHRPSFEEIFDQLWRNFFQQYVPKGERARPLHVEVLLSPREARRGGELILRVPVQSVCTSCRGAGHSGYFDCLRCDGTGVILKQFPLELQYPAGMTSDYSVSIPLNELKIFNTYLVVDFRISEELED